MRPADTKWQLDQVVSTPFGEVAAGSAGKGPPLVLAHGWPWSSYSWQLLIPGLAKYFQVYWYDMPGYGQSQKGAGLATSLNIQGEVFAHMLKHWRLERPHVVTHDFGGVPFSIMLADILTLSPMCRLISMKV